MLALLGYGGLVLAASLAFACGWKSSVGGMVPSPTPARASLGVRNVFPIINPRPFGYILSPFPFGLADTAESRFLPLSPVTLWKDHY